MRDGRTDERQTREDKATQPLDAGRLSFAILDTETSLAFSQTALLTQL